MENKKLWMLSLFFFLIVIAPVLLIMMALVLTHIPLSHAFAYWLPVAVAGTLSMVYGYFWAKNQKHYENC